MRIRCCKRCSKAFETERRSVYVCPECSSTSHRDTIIRDRTCLICGAVFQSTPNAKYCPTCRVEKQRENNVKNKRNGVARPIGSEDICIRCGSRYIVTGSAQKWCKACSAEGHKEVQRAYHSAYRTSHKEQIAAYAALMRENIKYCVVCGKVFGGRGPSVTCSDECAAIQLQRRIERKKRKRSGCD